jgi:hypothetical protein
MCLVYLDQNYNILDTQGLQSPASQPGLSLPLDLTMLNLAKSTSLAMRRKVANHSP